MAITGVCCYGRIHWDPILCTVELKAPRKSNVIWYFGSIYNGTKVSVVTSQSSRTHKVTVGLIKIAPVRSMNSGCLIRCHLPRETKGLFTACEFCLNLVDFSGLKELKAFLSTLSAEDLQNPDLKKDCIPSLGPV